LHRDSKEEEAAESLEEDIVINGSEKKASDLRRIENAMQGECSMLLGILEMS